MAYNFLFSRTSFENVVEWLEDLKSNCSSQIVIMLVGNKSDLQIKRTVPFEEGKALASKFDMLFMEASAKSGDGIDKVFYLPAKRIFEMLES